MKLFLVTMLFVSGPGFAAVQKMAASGGQVVILAKGRPSFIKIEGKGSPASGRLAVDGEKVTGEFEFDLATLDTGIETRNHHMKEKYLEVQKFPKAVLVINKVNHLASWSFAQPSLKDDEFEGQLTLHGVTRPVSGRFSMTEKRAVEAKFSVKLSDYKVDIPSFGGVVVADDVDISVKIDKLNSL